MVESTTVRKVKPLSPEKAKANVAGVRAAADKAMNEVIHQSLADLLMNATESDLVGKDVDVEVRKGNTVPAAVWIGAPAQWRFSALSYRRLLKVAEWMGMQVKELNGIQAQVIGNSKVVLIRPAMENDRTAYPLGRYKGSSGAAVNLAELLGAHGLFVETGYREKFDVYYVPRESALWPGLVVDLGQPKARVKEKVKQEEPEAPAK